MKHGRFLATISSSILLASPLCAAQDPSYMSQMDVLEYFISLFNKLNEGEIKKIATQIDRTRTVNNYEDESIKTEFEGKTEDESIKTEFEGKIMGERVKEAYETVYGCLSGKYFLKVGRVYTVVENNGERVKRFATIKGLAEYLLNRYITGYKGASDDWRNCYFFVMCKILRKGI